MTIARLRLVFAALALALAIPGALLVRRALESVAMEREARDRAVAERVFDVMESSLSALLAAEEARPASDYDFASPASPLRARPRDSLALGWFQVEADGRVSAPAWSPRAAALGAEIAQEGARLEAAAPDARAARAKDSGAPAPLALESPRDFLAPPAPASDTAAPVAPLSPEPAAAASSPQPAQAPSPLAVSETDAFAALSKLNTGAKEREERKQRVYVEEQSATEASALVAQASAEAAAPPAPASDERLRSEALVAGALAAEPSALREEARKREPDAAAERAGETLARAKAADAWGAGSEAATGDGGANAAAGSDATASAKPAPEARRSDAGRARAPQREPDAVFRAALDEAAAAGAAPAAARGGAQRARARQEAPSASKPGALVRVAVDPMRGRLARGGELLLVRSAWIGARGVRQGVAYGRAALERVLDTQTLAATLPTGRIALVTERTPRSEAPGEPGTRAYRHRFAEPFNHFAVELSFAPLVDASARNVYWLAAAFALASAGGLFAAYRTTAVALHFAERRSNFAAAVSHELKTPLTAIRLYAEMLRDGLVSGDEKRREYTASITAESERLSRLIGNVLEFSRLEQGARAVALTVGDVVPAVREGVELLRAHASKNGLALDLATEAELPPVRFERDALLQVLFNLVDNAIKYGRGEPARIEIACRRAGAGVALVVRDHGPGVPRDELARILEPFYRRGDELTRSAPGAGIGLALVRSLAQQMGAALALENAAGGGLAVSLTLPGVA